MRRALSLTVVVGILAAAVLAQDEPRFSGDGDHLTEAIELLDGLVIIAAEHRGDSNFAIELLDAEGNHRGLAANTIGDYAGARAVSVSAGTYYLQITASGPWAINADNPNLDQPPDGLPTAHEATGDLVLGPFRLSSGLDRVSLSHKGESNFTVILYRSDGALVGLLANEIGDYEGSTGQRISSDGLYFVDVQADGAWTFSMQ